MFTHAAARAVDGNRGTFTHPDSPIATFYYDIDLGAAKLIETGIFTEADEESVWITDVLEDRLLLDDFLLPKKWDVIGADPVPTGVYALRDANPHTADGDVRIVDNCQ